MLVLQNVNCFHFENVSLAFVSDRILALQVGGTAMTAIPKAGRASLAVKSALVGGIFGLDAAGHCLALATILFAGPLSAGLGLGTGLLLLGTMVSSAVLWRFSGLAISLGISQDTTIAILAPAIALATSGLAGGPQTGIATAIAIMGVSAILSGISFWIIGRLRLGRFVRMFPYPVAAGFLASSGLLLVIAAFAVLTDSGHFPDIASRVLSQHYLPMVLPALAMAGCLILASRLWTGATPVLVVIVAFVAGYYGLTAALGIDQAQATERGFLPDVGPGGSLGAGAWIYSEIDWGKVLQTAPTFAAIILLNLIGVLLNFSGTELATRQDIDENRELRITGIANIGIGMMGGLTAYLQGGATILMSKLGVHRTPMVAGHLAVLALAIWAAGDVVVMVPKFIAAALLMFIGLSMLADWLWESRKRLVTADWLIILGIVAVTAILGILPAIGFGLMLAIASFAVGYARMPVIRKSETGRTRRSILDRDAASNAALAQSGDRIRIFHLQGALFFGSVEQLIRESRRAALDPKDTISDLILDLGDVHTFDSSACAGLDKLAFLLERQSVTIHLCAVSSPLRATMEQWGMSLSGGQGTFRLWPTLDDALEHCEDRLIATSISPVADLDMGRILEGLVGSDPRLPDLMRNMEKVTLVPGDVLIRSSDPSRDLFVLESGRLGVFLPDQGSGPIRVRSMGPGAVVGEVAYILSLPRSADVIAERHTTAYRLSEATMNQIAQNDAALSALVNRMLAQSLAVKVVQTNLMVSNRT
jgi:SulP family sulfate permease